MLDTFNAVWTALTTTNEELIKVILIPCNFVEVTITMLLFTTLLNIDCTKKQKFIYVISLSVFGIINSYIVPSTYNVFFNMIALPVFVFLILKTTILKSILAEILPIVIGIIIENFLLRFLMVIFNINYNDASNIPIFRIAFIAVTDFIIYILYFFAKKYSFNIKLLDNMRKNDKILLTTNLIFIVITIFTQTYLTSFYSNTLPIFITFLSMISLLGYYIITVFTINRITKLHLTTQDLELSQQYNKTLSILHDNIRCFKHDYNNMLTTIGGYIQSEDIEGMKKYYSQLLSDCSRSNSLSTLSPEVINEPAIYSLLTNKYYKASELGIDINIEAFLDFNKLNMKIYEFTKILGILLDNVIEAANECENKIINITICKDFKVNRQLLIIENTYTNKDVNTEKIYEKGFSSKQNNTGLGLWETRKILKRNNNLNLFTTKNNEFFKQQLEIYC